MHKVAYLYDTSVRIWKHTNCICNYSVATNTESNEIYRHRQDQTTKSYILRLYLNYLSIQAKHFFHLNRLHTEYKADTSIHIPTYNNNNIINNTLFYLFFGFCS